MTREKAIECLRKNRPISDPRPCGMELCDAVDMAISALRQQEHFRDLTKKVEPPKPPTNADRIRAMSDEELVEFIKNIKVRAALCKAVKNNDAFEELCSAEWLQQPAEEDDHV